MKRLIVLVLSMGALFAMQAPASATGIIHGQVCETIYNGVFTKAEKVCINVIESADNADWWIQFVGSVPAGYAGPYQVVFTGRMFSSKTGASCDGLYPSCNGSGDIVAYTEPDGTFKDTTHAAGPNQHYCNMWGYFNGTVYWTATAAEGDGPFNSSNVNTVPDCVL